MTNEEIISSFMESKPTGRPNDPTRRAPSFGGWWYWVPQTRGEEGYWMSILSVFGQRELLGCLYEVEEKLSTEQWFQYEIFPWDMGTAIGHSHDRVRLHAGAPARIRALAQVLKEAVERGGI